MSYIAALSFGLNCLVFCVSSSIELCCVAESMALLTAKLILLPAVVPEVSALIALLKCWPLSSFFESIVDCVSSFRWPVALTEILSERLASALRFNLPMLAASVVIVPAEVIECCDSLVELLGNLPAWGPARGAPGVGPLAAEFDIAASLANEPPKTS